MLLYLLLPLLSLLSLAAADGPLCSPSGVCLAVRTFVNGTNHDFYVTLRGRVNNGWAATGLGQEMNGALYFVAYPGKADNRTTVSIRTTNDHDPPQPLTTSQTPKGLSFRPLSSSRNATFFTASFVCYACDTWKGSSVNANSRDQKWLFAIGGSQQKLNSDDTSEQIFQHPMSNGAYGTFSIDMQRTLSPTAGAPSLDGNSTGGIISSSSPDYVIKLHGLLLGGAFLAVFPAGVLALRSNLRLAVKAHMAIQALATFFCILGMVFGIVLSLNDPEFSDFSNGHQIFGFVLVGWVVLQFSAGLVHHIIFRRTGKSTPIAPVHIWSGRFLLPLGLTNGGLGLLLAGNRLGAVAYYILGFIASAMVSFLAYKWANARKEERMAGVYPGHGGDGSYNNSYASNTPFEGPGGVPLSQQPVGQGVGGSVYGYGHAQQASQSDVWNARPPQYHEAM